MGMANSVAINTPLAGSPQGNFLDDLTNPLIGQWPKTLAIQGITRITVFGGGIIDSMRITYQLQNNPTPATVQHGGPGGVQMLDFAIGANQKLIAVYGAQLVTPGPFGNNNIVQLSFVVADPSGNVPTVQVFNASGSATGQTVKFDFSWPLTAATSYTFQPAGQPNSYLQGIAFSKVVDQAVP